MPNKAGVTLVELGGGIVIWDEKYQKSLDTLVEGETEITSADIEGYADDIMTISAEQAAEILANGREL